MATMSGLHNRTYIVCWKQNCNLYKLTPLLHNCYLGLKGTYQGLPATIVKQGSNQAIRFFVYTNLKSWIQGGDPSKDIGSIKTFLIGGVAGAASVFGYTPVDVVKTRMHVLRVIGFDLLAQPHITTSS